MAQGELASAMRDPAAPKALAKRPQPLLTGGRRRVVGRRRVRLPLIGRRVASHCCLQLHSGNNREVRPKHLPLVRRQRLQRRRQKLAAGGKRWLPCALSHPIWRHAEHVQGATRAAAAGSAGQPTKRRNGLARQRGTASVLLTHGAGTAADGEREGGTRWDLGWVGAAAAADLACRAVLIAQCGCPLQPGVTRAAACCAFLHWLEHSSKALHGRPSRPSRPCDRSAADPTPRASLGAQPAAQQKAPALPVQPSVSPPSQQAASNLHNTLHAATGLRKGWRLCRRRCRRPGPSWARSAGALPSTGRPVW